MAEETTEGVTESVAAAPSLQEQATQPNEKELNFRALRESAEALKRQNEFLQMQMMQQQKQGGQSNAPQQFKDDDLLTFGEYQKIRAGESQERMALQAKIDELEMRATHSDYNDVISNYLPDVLKEDPDLAYAIKDNPRMQKLAYKLAQASPRYHQERLARQNQSAVDRIVENASRPQPANARKNVTVQDEEARMASMSDDDIIKMFNMAKARS